MTAMMLTFIIYGYIDGIFINKIEYAGGDVVAESNMYGRIIGIVYYVLMEILLVASLLSRKKWKNVVVFTSILFIGMNTAGLVSDLIKVDISKDKTQNMYVESRKDISKVGSKENIIFFIFDRFDTDYYKAVLQDDPTFFDDLDGFTYYDNNITHYLRTFPSAAYMVTGEEYIGEESPEEYLTNCYKDSSYLKDLKENGYNIKLYGEKHYTYVNGDSLLGIADNIEKVDGIDTNNVDIAIYLNNLSLVRNFSYFLSMSMIRDTNQGTVEKLATINCEDGIYKTEDEVLYKDLMENGLTVSDNEKNYIYIHLRGSHSPYVIDENCQRVEKSNALAQTKGSFLVIKKYLSELKRLGLYDNSTIIITGDHGKPYSDTVPVKDWEEHKFRNTGPTVALFFKPRNSENEKLNYSNAPVQSANLIPTIVQDAEIKTNTDYGYSLKDIESGAKQERTYYHMIHLIKRRKIMFDIYDVGDDATDMNNWKLRERIETKHTWY